MSKKSFTILILIFLAIGIVVLGIAWYESAKRQSNGGTLTAKDFFPFGKGATTVTPGKPNQPGQSSQQPGTTPGTTVIPRLRKVSDNPVIGYTLIKEEVPVDPNNPPAPTLIPVAANFTFSKTLKKGDNNTDVQELQKMLNQCPLTEVATSGSGSPGKEGTLFGAATQKAVIAFQNMFPDILQADNITSGNGIVDTATQAKLTAGFTCTVPATAASTILKDVVRYVEKGTSNIYDALADTLDTTRLSNTTIPGVHEAFFANGGQIVFLRSLESDNQTIDTIIANVPEPIPGGDALPELTGAEMPKNIENLAVSPDGNQVLYTLVNGEDLVGMISDIDGKNQKNVFSSPFIGWLPQWATQDELVFTAKATGYAAGYSYETTIGKGDFTKIAGPIDGLTTLMSPDGKSLLLSENTAAGPELALMNVATKQIRDLNLATLPEKCVWTANSFNIYCAVPNSIPSGVYPDDWYQGTVLFSDSFWAINAQEDLYSNELLFDPTTIGGEATDGVHLSIDDANRYLYFVNKDTGILWQYDLAPQLSQPPATDTTSPTTSSGTVGTASSGDSSDSSTTGAATNTGTTSGSTEGTGSSTSTSTTGQSTQ